MKFVQALNLAIQGKRVRHDEQKGDWYEILVDTIASIKVGTTFTVVESDVSAVKVNVKYMKINMTNAEYKDFVCFVDLSNGQFHAEPRDTANKLKVKVILP